LSDEVQPLSAAQPDPQAEPAAAAAATPPPAPPVKPVPTKPAGSSNRVRARLARLGVQRSNPYNPVLEPLLRIVRSNDPKIETATLRQLEQAYQVA
jgi:GTP pyrophosphokinase